MALLRALEARILRKVPCATWEVQLVAHGEREIIVPKEGLAPAEQVQVLFYRFFYGFRSLLRQGRGPGEFLPPDIADGGAANDGGNHFQGAVRLGYGHFAELGAAENKAGERGGNVFHHGEAEELLGAGVPAVGKARLHVVDLGFFEQPGAKEHTAHKVRTGKGSRFQNAHQRLFHRFPGAVLQGELAFIIGRNRLVFRYIYRELFVFLEQERAQDAVVGLRYYKGKFIHTLTGFL